MLEATRAVQAHPPHTMTPPSATVFLIDVDNTLLDNDGVQDDLDQHIANVFGADAAKKYWEIYEDLREKLSYTD